jgi:hypothetical protein
MFKHRCQVEDQRVLAQRANPLDASWNEWTLVVCPKCKTLREWQHHSDEQMHGGDLQISAIPTTDYLHHIYGLAESDVALILGRRKKVRRYNRHTGIVEEHDD